MGPLTYVAFGLLAAFVVDDAAAHFTRYRYGETVSAFVRAKRIRRAGAAVTLLLLFLHLVLLLF